MLALRKANDRGHANFGWLNSRHTFSFASYYDPRHMGISELRVINDDWVSPGMGFETHPHQDMEIISYVVEGSIEHKDTMGFHTVLKAGDVQVMSAGSGIRHSEFNPSATENLNFLQIWIRPDTHGLKPAYYEKNFSDAKGVTLIASADARDGSMKVNQDISLYKLKFDHQNEQLNISAQRTFYLHMVGGEMVVNGETLLTGDGMTITDEERLTLDISNQAEALLFDLP
ncbi:pirin family protein [Oceanospirillum sediminis]|uniref:Pirin family protein n=1 Tax=Oceanospirillum sediminis TaxID=2760088 RepID=A0A839INT3_9GAMM|nr:pirin family protein [Oceanospirillum sediminis]MBB1486350.1 pirin family protein [Oceanospirillum sediminis]